jgi:carbonic anhydrase/acetyltransferase-like protein (isoleucine patch superfamily)
VAHLCLIHGADVGEEALVGNSSTVLDGARIGVRAMIAAGRARHSGDSDPRWHACDGSTVQGEGAARRARPAARWVELNQPAIQALAQRHRVGVKPL